MYVFKDFTSGKVMLMFLVEVTPAIERVRVCGPSMIASPYMFGKDKLIA